MKSLNRLYWIKKEILQLEDQLKELTELSAVEITGMPKGNKKSNPVEQFTERLMFLQDKLNKKMNEYIEEKIYAEDTINKIDNPEVRIIARKRYIENKTWEDIGEELMMDRTTASRKLQKYERTRNYTKSKQTKKNV